VLSISSCIYGLQFLFMDPNPDDPLNKDAVGLAPFTASFCSQTPYIFCSRNTSG
jgi:hypothetical protein